MIIDQSYSNFICLKCSETLKEFSIFWNSTVKNQKELYEFTSIADNSNFDKEIDFKLLRTVVVKCEVINVHDEMFKEISLPSPTIKLEKEIVIDEECESFSLDDDNNHFQDHEQESIHESKDEPKIHIPAVKRLSNMKIESKFYNSKDYTKLQCDHCKFKAPFQAAYDKHMRKYHRGLRNEVTCKICGKLISRSGIKSHILRLHDRRKDLECDACSKRFFCKQILVKHLKSHIPAELQERFVCDICNVGYARKDNIINHMQINHMKHKAKLVCSYCGKVFVHRRHLSLHVNLVHKKIKNYKCKFCKTNFEALSKLKDHLLTNHKSEALSESFICDVCGLTFSYQKGLSKHKRHHSELAFKCTFKNCNRAFTFNFLLAKHVRNVHENLRKEQCSYCLKSFFDKSRLKKHLSLLHERVQVNCPVEGCAHDFHRIDYCRRHIRNDHTEIDNDQKKIACNLASQSFSKASEKFKISNKN